MITGWLLSAEDFVKMPDRPSRALAKKLMDTQNPRNDTPNQQVLQSLREALQGRATGLWRLEGAYLRLVGFAPAPDLDATIAEAFVTATRAVRLDQLALGIVKAFVTRQPAISRTLELPPEVGSGYWLRAFGATRSVAVPLLSANAGEPPLGVLSIALGDAPEDSVVCDRAIAYGLRLERSEGTVAP